MQAPTSHTSESGHQPVQSELPTRPDLPLLISQGDGDGDRVN